MGSESHDVHRETVIARFAKLQSFITSALVILSILTVVTEQQIREFESEIAVFARSRREAAARLPARLQTMAAISKTLHPAVDTAIRNRMRPLQIAARTIDDTVVLRLGPVEEVSWNTLAAELGLAEQDVPLLQGSIRHLQASRIMDITDDEERERRLISPSGRLDAGDDEKAHDQIIGKVSGLTPGDHDRIDRMFRLPPPKNRKVMQADIDAVTKTLNDASSTRGRMYEEPQRQMDELSKAFTAYADDRDALHVISAEVEKVRTKTQSLPSPFGSFNLHPRLALLFLAFATAGAYLIFSSSERSTLRIARDIASGSPVVLSPSWAYTADPLLRTVLGWRVDGVRLRTASAIALHAYWLGLSCVLLFEVFRWRAIELLRFLPTAAVAAVLVALNVIAAVMAWLHFVSMRTVPPPAGVRPRRAGMSRRTSFRLAAAGFFAFLSTGLRLREERSVWPVAKHPALDLPLELVRNRRTLVTHGRTRCKDHLPKRQAILPASHERDGSIGPAAAGYPGLHRGHAVAIFFEAVKIERDTLERIYRRYTENYYDYLDEYYPKREVWSTNMVLDLLHRSLELQPWSFHLYDQIIGVLGRQKRYGEIRSFLRRMMNEAEAGLRADPGSREARNRVRAIAARMRGVETRTHAAQKRAAKSAALLQQSE